jgi:DNA-binding transcriptional MerR regulator
MFRIGEFAKLSRTSARMLRHYDELGLLKPSFVDEKSGYRYYTADQLIRLQRILSFQDMGLSLFEMTPLLSADFSNLDFSAMLEQKLLVLEADLERRKLQIRKLRSRLRSLPSSQIEVVVRSVRSVLVASIHEAIGLDLEPALTELETFASAYQTRDFAPPLALHHLKTVEAAIPLRFEVPSSARVQVYRLMAVPQMACVVHCGGYETLPMATKALFDWVRINGYVAVGALREVYLRFGADANLKLPPSFLTSTSSEFVTELQLPIQAKGAL